MNDIDFIKKCCEYANDYDMPLLIEVGVNDYNMYYYPLLLQRAIEGVNNSNLKWHIVMSKYNEIFINCLDYQLGFGNGDKAKRVALKWIFNR